MQLHKRGHLKRWPLLQGTVFTAPRRSDFACNPLFRLFYWNRGRVHFIKMLVPYIVLRLTRDER